ncbi:MAG: hypothetical protein ACTSQS_01980, partial [Promethearchaeota archaeon]
MNLKNNLTEEFPITGPFNIPKIFPVEIINKNIDINKSLRFPIYREQSGTRDNPNKGFYIHKQLESTEFINDHPPLREILKNLIMIDFIIDDYKNISSYKNGKIIKEINRIGVKVNNIFWIKPDLIIVKGSLDTAEKFKESFQNNFRREIILGEPYKFDSWFLLWLIYNYRINNSEVIRDFYLDLMLDMTVEGDIIDIEGQKAAARKSLNVSKSLVILLPLLAKKLPIEIKLGISVNNLAAVIELNIKGRIKIYQTRGIFKDLSNLDRTVLGCFIIKRIIDLYNYWNSLTNSEKIPPPEFIDDIVKECKQRGLEITGNVIDTRN